MDQAILDLQVDSDRQAQELMSLRLEILMVRAALQRQTQNAEELAALAPASMGGDARMPGTEPLLRWSSGGGGGGPQAWDYTIAGTSFSVTECVYMRGPVTLVPTVAALTLALEDAYIAAHIDLADGTAELVEGSSIAAVTDAAPLDDDMLAKVLLYHVVKTGDAWAVTMDYRSIPQLGVRL